MDAGTIESLLEANTFAATFAGEMPVEPAMTAGGGRGRRRRGGRPVSGGLPARLLVTGGAGFIGSAFVRRLLLDRHPTARVTVLDKLTYAGNRANLADVEDDPALHVRRRATSPMRTLVDRLAADADAIVNFAAESHVDRSIEEPDAFIQHRRVSARSCCSRPPAATATRASSRSAPTRSTATFRRALDRGRRAQAAQPVLGQQAGRRPARRRLLHHLRPAHAPHPRQQQLRPVPVSRRRSSRSSSPTRSTTSRCRSTATASRCATGCTSTTTAMRSSVVLERGEPGDDVQRRRRQRAHQPRPDANRSSSCSTSR